MRVALIKLGVLLGYIAASQTASADTILLPTPDIEVKEIAVSYDAGTGSFSATGYASGFTHDNLGNQYSIASSPGSFAINGTITSAGVVTGGTLTVTGCIAEIPAGCSGGSLLQGILSFVQFSGVADTQLTLGFSTLTGDLALLYGTIAYVNLNNIAFPGNFLITFNNNPTDPADPFQGLGDIGAVGAVPEPGTWAMMIIGLGLVAFAKRKSAGKAA